MADMPNRPGTEKMIRGAQERRQQAIRERQLEERHRAESDALRRANIVESGTPEERAALRQEYADQAARGRRLVLEARAERGNFLAALELETDLQIRWTSGEAPASVVWDPPTDRRLGSPVR